MNEGSCSTLTSLPLCACRCTKAGAIENPLKSTEGNKPTTLTGHLPCGGPRSACWLGGGVGKQGMEEAIQRAHIPGRAKGPCKQTRLDH